MHMRDLGEGTASMTETTDKPIVHEALALIDAELARLASREMVTATEVSNLLLDLRLVLTPTNTPEPLGAS